jgi:type I restriction enzyme, S subunit
LLERGREEARIIIWQKKVVVMSEWKKVKISEIIELIGGGTPKTSNPDYWNGHIPWLSVVDFNIGRKYVFDTEKTITEDGLHNSSTKLLKKGDIIISARGTVGVLSILGREMAFNQSCYGVRAKNGINDYVYYLLKDTVANLKQYSHGGVFDTITRNTFNEIEINLPPLPEQKAIAEVLSSLDDKIDLLHRQNKTLEQLAETLFRQWFLEEAKEDWEEGVLGDILNVKGGTTPSTKNPEFWDGEIHWTTPRDLSNSSNLYLLDTLRKITEKGLNKISSGLLPKGTLLLSSRAPVGYLAFSEVPIAINQGYIAIIADKGFSNHWIYLWLKENMDYVKSHANGSTFQEISKTSFKALQVVIPPKMLLEEFDRIIKNQFKKIKANTYQIRTLEKMRDTLLPKLMSGDVSVNMKKYV